MGKGGGRKGWNGGGSGLGDDWNSQLPQLEGQLSQMANQVYESILNLNVSPADVRGQAEETFSLRGHILGIYGMDASGGGGAPWGGAAAGGIPDANAKGRLTQLLTKKHKKCAEKGDVVFDIADAPGGGYIATCSGTLVGQSITGEACPGKKAAEHAAARAAIAALFPEAAMAITPAQPDPRGKKRGVQETSTGEDMEPKVKMVRFMQLLLGRSTTKQDLVFETEQDPTSKTCVTTLTLNSYEGKVYVSDPCQTKKASEAAAATKALEDIGDQFETLEREHQEKKKSKNQKALAALVERTKEKKEAQALEKAAAGATTSAPTAAA